MTRPRARPTSATGSALPADLARFLRDELGEELGDGAAPGGCWQVTGPLWRWQGKATDGSPSSMAWFFITIDGTVAEAIRAASPGRTAAWGSIYVTATIGATTWRTSLFPSKEAGGYLLPIKAGVRKAERILEGELVGVRVEV